jgi:hypothetical protein
VLRRTLRSSFGASYKQGVKNPDFGHLERWLGLIAREQQFALTG